MTRNKWRGIKAAILGLLITVKLNLKTLLTAWPYRKFMGKKAPPRFTHYQREWASAVHNRAIEGVLGAKVVLANDCIFPSKEQGVIDVLICNHPPTPLAPSMLHCILANFSPWIMVVSKIELLKGLWGLFFGQAQWAMWGGIFIDRRDRKQAFAVIREAVEKFAGYAPFLIFPDGSRPTDEKRRMDIEGFSKVAPDVAIWLKHTLFPRAGGAFTIVSAIDETCRPDGSKYRVRLIDITCWSSARSLNVGEADALVGATLFVDVRVLEDEEIPRDRDEFERLFVSLFRRKNELIDKSTNQS